MSTLKHWEREKLEELFDMSSGYVLHFGDTTFGYFFDRFGIDIHSDKYLDRGTSKAKKLRRFWDIENDPLVGKITKELIEEIPPERQNTQLAQECKEIAARLLMNVPVHMVFTSWPSGVQEHFDRQERALDNGDTAQVIGTAKETLESVFKTILKENGQSPTNRAKMSELCRAVMHTLDVGPYEEKMVKSIVHAISERRNKDGTGHGREGSQTNKPEASVARLYANSARDLAIFLWEKHEMQRRRVRLANGKSIWERTPE